MDNLHIQLLKKLEEVGFNDTYDISEFMDEHFDHPTMDSDGNISSGYSTVREFFRNLKDLGHIQIDMDMFHSSILTIQHGYPVKSDSWFNKDGFHIRLGVKGSEYLHQHRLIKTTRWVSVVTLGVAGVSTIAALVTLGIAFTENEQYKQERKSFLRELKTLQTEQKSLKAQITYLRGIGRKFSPFGVDTLRTTLSENKNGSPKKAK